MSEFFINLVVFVFSLALLIVVHEFGHFITAKLFKVYVTEFSIGFGPAIFTTKKEGKETRFSIRSIPLGGYCAMVGEDLPELSEEQYDQLSDKDKELVDLYKVVPQERKLDGIAKWKRAIIFVAGVTLNFVLGYILLFGYYISTPLITEFNNQVDVQENSIASSANWKDDDVIKQGNYVITLHDVNGKVVNEIKGGGECIEKTGNLYEMIDVLSNNEPTNSLDKATYYFVTAEEKEITFELIAKENEGEYIWPKIGIVFSPNYETAVKLNFGQAIVEAGISFGEYSIAIFKGIGMMFTPEGFAQTGGVVAIFQVQQEMMNMGIGYVVNLWAMISINLGIMNLLPFPGLDGWHLAVILVEGIIRKEMPKKAKKIASTIGMILLFGLMIVIMFKDVFTIFLK